MVNYFKNILTQVTEALDLCLLWDQREARVRDILLEVKEEALFDLINSEQYPLLVGFCYSLGVETVQNEEKAFEFWSDDVTSYGHYLVGRCYFYGLGVDTNYDK